jgi:hypothetical protein
LLSLIIEPPSKIPSAVDYVFFRVNALIKNSKFKKGIRAWVYEIASSFTAFYDGDKSTSIFYNGGDLHIRILFRTEDGCVSFLNKLDDNLSHFQLVEPMQFDKNPEMVRLSSRPVNIYRRDYIPADSDSENYSLAITRITHVSALTHLDRFTEFQMVEDSDLEDFVGLDVYKCHLRSQSAFVEDKNNINNWLWLSWSLHQRFDGLNTTGRHRVPQIAIRFEKAVDGALLTEGDTEWYRVDVAIECPDADIFGVVRHRIKKGMIVNEQRREISTWLYVQDPNDFKRCLTYKYDETHELWKAKKRGEEVTEVEASVLRRSARIAILKAHGYASDR